MSVLETCIERFVSAVMSSKGGEGGTLEKTMHIPSIQNTGARIRGLVGTLVLVSIIVRQVQNM